MYTFPKRLLASCCLLSSLSVAAPDPEAFKNPPHAYLPRTWMHAMNGNLSKEGFTKDFEALADAGIGGALVFHIARGIPDGPTAFGSDAFNDVLAHAAVEAERVGIEMGVHNCDGWSSSGGPWVTPELSMKKVVFAEAVTTGGATQLTLPPADASQGYYRDIALLAWPANEDVDKLAKQKETLSASSPLADASLLRDGNLDTEFTPRPDAKGEVWIQSTYSAPVTIRSLHTEQRSRHGTGSLWISKDGSHFEKIGPLTQSRTGKHHWSFTGDYRDGLTAKAFRIVFNDSFPIRQFQLSAYPRLSDWQTRNAIVEGSTKLDKSFPQSSAIDRKAIRILHKGSLPNDEIAIDLPPGSWIVTRFGYTTTDARNHPASDAGRGLEIDKLNAEAIDFHFEQYVAKVVKEAQARGSNALLYSEIDSFEMGGNNWTQNFDQTFYDRWGYDLIEWLPAFAGHVVESVESTDAVLTDMRGLVSNLMTQNYFQRFTDLCREHGMKSYIEPYGFGTLDELAVGGASDMTMGEFWVVDEGFKGTFDAAVSSARTYGKKVISAESFTAWSEVNWRGHPYSMKIFGDHAWASGVNETMFHRFAHQPNTHVIPGMTMGSVGSHIDRTQTWWHNAGKAWFKYLARGSYLLQQGMPASDFLVFVGDTTPNKVPGWNSVKLPAGTLGDFVNADVLINRVRVEDGKLVLPEGTRYNALYLHNSQSLRLATLKRIETLARQGAVVVGLPPSQPIGYIELKNKRHEFDKIVTQVWGDGSEARAYGKGYLIPQASPQSALDYLQLGPDLLIDGSGAEHFTHRRIGEGELYFFFNETDEYRELSLDFRVQGLAPEVWDADSGKIERVESYHAADGRTRFPLLVEPGGSRFIYFRSPSSPTPQTSPAKLALLQAYSSSQTPASAASLLLDQPWTVSFDPKWGGPGKVVMQELQDWTESALPGIRHYSGTAVYETEVELPSDWRSSGETIVLDLGHVSIAADVTINGHSYETLWKPPFALDATQSLKPGRNRIKIEVTNVWTNRLIGDEAFPRNDGYEMGKPMPEWFSANQPPPPSDRVTWTAWNFYDKEELQRLEPSGLKGPVRLLKSSD
ncbi:glycosyl hydrolase [Pelagicoccus sp. SDUM812005]|uniref:glycosyl hydrolase n=1 Tax=Pelagicoccus sp. SDUM812005 TaxID=3041257 RepID=UPI00280E448A|nr:glycosyl hydrolase [Pelagicoccus sp. SDUM812005]MDQ8179069.1 glycosyl hydrolase [Pelagicoccus sp. SDUM812005]